MCLSSSLCRDRLNEAFPASAPLTSPPPPQFFFKVEPLLRDLVSPLVDSLAKPGQQCQSALTTRTAIQLNSVIFLHFKFDQPSIAIVHHSTSESGPTVQVSGQPIPFLVVSLEVDF